MLILAAALLGAIFGSFIATLVVRWPTGQSVARGRSACDACGAPVPAARLIPSLSFVVQRGKAACCGGSIDQVHPAAELLAVWAYDKVPPPENRANPTRWLARSWFSRGKVAGWNYERPSDPHARIRPPPSMNN